MEYIDRLIEKLSKAKTGKEASYIMKEIDSYDSYISDTIHKHKMIFRNEVSAKGKYSRKYYKTMEYLISDVKVEDKKKYVKDVFDDQKRFQKKNDASIAAIMDLKKHNNKNQKNIYGQKIKGR